jgi:hypothetical protein
MSLGVPMVAQGGGLALDSALLGSLPSVPARLLLLGEHTQALAAQCTELGYAVTALPVCQPQDYAQFPSSTRQGICQVDLPLPQDNAGSFAAAVVLGLTHQVHPLALFNGLAQWLAEDAVVVLTGQPTTDGAPRMAHWLDYVVAIGARSGFAEQLGEPAPVGHPGSGFTRILRKGAATRWQLRHVRASDFDGISTLFQEVFGHPLSRALWD